MLLIRLETYIQVFIFTSQRFFLILQESESTAGRQYICSHNCIYERQLYRAPYMVGRDNWLLMSRTVMMLSSWRHRIYGAGFIVLLKCFITSWLLGLGNLNELFLYLRVNEFSLLFPDAYMFLGAVFPSAGLRWKNWEQKQSVHNTHRWTEKSWP